MKRDYIPEKDAAFSGWLGGFTKYIENHYAELGLTAADKDNLVAANTAWKTDYQALITAQGAARGAKGTKDQTRNTTEALARNLAQRSTVYPGTTNAHRAGMGITVPDDKQTPTAPEYVVTLDPPLLLLEFRRGQVVVHFGVNPANEKENAKPDTIVGANIWYRVGSGPWQFVALDTNSPYIHNFVITEPLNVEYRVQWSDRKGRVGIFSQTAKCTVTP
jgi:hypothetical protein